MGTDDNKAVIRRWMDAWIRRDVTSVDRLFAPDYTVNGTLVGGDGVRQAIHMLHTAFADISAELNEIVAEGDQVAIRWTLRGTHRGDFMGVPPTSRTVELRGINIYRLADGRIAANHEQTNVLEVIQVLTADR